jgi:hypothetical protein
VGLLTPERRTNRGRKAAGPAAVAGAHKG